MHFIHWRTSGNNFLHSTNADIKLYFTWKCSLIKFLWITLNILLCAPQRSPDRRISFANWFCIWWCIWCIWCICLRLMTQKSSLKKAFRFFLNSKFNLIKPDKLSVCLLLECKHTSHRVERKQTHRLPPANNLQLRASKTGLIRCQECHH